MSVLSFPRLYLRGFIQWNPATGNNHANLATAEPAAAGSAAERSKAQAGSVDLNWARIGLPKPGVHDLAGRKAVRDWFITWPSPYAGAGGSHDFVPGEWNYFGNNAAAFVHGPGETDRSLVVGGALAADRPAAANDPMLATPVILEGGRPPTNNPDRSTHAWPTGDAPARNVDCYPFSSWSSQIFWQRLGFGVAGCGIVMHREARLHARWLSFGRNASLTSAGAVSVSWQTAVAWDQLRIENTKNSELLSAFEAARERPGVRGLMFRFNTYLTVNNQAGGQDNQADFYPRLAARYAQALREEGQPDATVSPFYNPACSRWVGAVGLWQDHESRSTPEGRFLVPALAASYVPGPWTDARARGELTGSAFRDQANAPETGVPEPDANLAPAALSCRLGTALAQLVQTSSTEFSLALDFQNTFPEDGAAGQKVDWGEVAIGHQTADGFQAVVHIGPDLYGQAAYERLGGLADVPLTAAQFASLSGRPLALQASVRVRSGEILAPAATRILLVEQVLTANTDQRAVYASVGDPTQTLSIRVTRGLDGEGADAPAGTQVLVVKYQTQDGRNTAVQPGSDRQGLRLVDAAGRSIERPLPMQPAPQTAPQTAADTLSGSNWAVGAVLTLTRPGAVDLHFDVLDAGFPLLAFVPFVGPVPPLVTAVANVGTAGYAQCRIWPHDAEIEADFVGCWNAALARGDDLRAASWAFIWENILYFYDFLFPVMLAALPLAPLPLAALPLADLARIEAAIDTLLAMLDPDQDPESPEYMPVTRDLSIGRRRALCTWAQLVARGYPRLLLAPPAPSPH